MGHIASLPLPALVGLEAARQALLLLAVEPRLGGVALAAPAGSGKSSLARGYCALLDGRAPFVELPLGADEDSLLGGIDLEATLRAGRRVPRCGALARADGGAVYVDGLNLLPEPSANLLLAALDRGAVQLEREGMSLRLPARFALIASYDPAEGPPRRHLLDRIGLLAVLPRAAGAAQRAEVARRNLACGPQGEAGAWQAELDLLRGLVLAAREQLPAVRITPEQIERLLAAAVALGVQGHRADLFAVRAACAAAALGLRDTVEDEDLEAATRLVILPRATRAPAEQPQDDGRRAEPPQDDGARPEPPPDAAPPDGAEMDAAPAEAPADQILSALACELPLDLAELPFGAVRRGRSGSRGATGGRRGRQIRSAPGDVRRARVDIAATLRAAAPWQPLRSRSAGRPRALDLRADDLRVKEFRSKAGALFCFAVDASGSMALHRMRQAKGAVHALLQQAYVHRDRVALLSFRGERADLLLPPSQSVELASRALDLLPTGGGTPLAAALLQALAVARQARGRGIFQTVLVLVTDGRANVGLRAARDGVQEEIRLLGRAVAAAGIRSIVVDTQRSYLSQGEARRLAGWLAGDYLSMPDASGAQLAEAALAARA